MKIKSACQACHCECGVFVTVEDGKVLKIEGDPDHPINRGKLCVKGIVYDQLLYSPDRLKYPLKRSGERGQGQWQRISWDEALDTIAARFQEVRAKYGPLSLAASFGTQPRGTFTSTIRLANALGTPNVTGPAHVSLGPAIIAEFATYGPCITAEVGPDYANARCILIWGANPLVAHPPRGWEIVAAKKRGAKLIVVDPRRTNMAAKADLWLQIRPGTDAALALGMMNIIINEKLYDKEFVDKWCVGFEQLARRVQEYPPERVSEITWIPTNMIREAAILYATTKPAAFHHRAGFEQNLNAVQTCRATTLLVALTGNIDVKGGNVFPNYPTGFMTRMDLMKEAPIARELAEKRVGAKEFPLYSGPDSVLHLAHTSLLIKAMMTGEPYPIKALFTTNNLLMTSEDTRYVWEALQKLDFMVAVDFFLTPTAELADIVLPAATWVEKDELCVNSYQNYITVRQKAMEPLGECWDDKKIAIEIARRMGGEDFRKWFPWDDPVGYINHRLRKAGYDFEYLKENGYIVEPIKYKSYLKKGFRTPSGKVELYSSVFEKFGYDGLPFHQEPVESPISTPELAKDYPYILITGGRDMSYFHTENRQVPGLRKLAPDPILDIHPETAATLGIKDGDWVWIETPKGKGRVQQKARFNSDIDPRVIHAKHGWWFPEKPGPDHGLWDSNINVVTSMELPFDPIIGATTLRGSLCKVSRV